MQEENRARKNTVRTNGLATQSARGRNLLVLWMFIDSLRKVQLAHNISQHAQEAIGLQEALDCGTCMQKEITGADKAHK